MIAHAPQLQPVPVLALATHRLGGVLALLRESLETARALRQDAWEFALEINQLHAAGATNTDLRWLLCMGYAAHALERSGAGSKQRLFRRQVSLAFSERSCFILTDEGLQASVRQDAAGGPAKNGRAGCLEDTPDSDRLSPLWDARVRQLRWHGRVVKQFRRPAPNQEAILAALEEEGWPPQIDDPLPQSPDLDSRARLHDAIKGLNRHQDHRLLVFRGDGTGEGVIWQAVPS
jgi:hypothetical protein